ncbi:septation protein A [Kinneretia asaccharophila]|uniref:Inner membrane-spanning protein YciB n=1 Tax=Roseateles asaccharophilus TaxID=582607 RepID=A0A4R6N6V9_9BURK|nr:septation protein A [Roseateles asaccharophilus]MDN3546151.1 septation protein A [Roseateles asaccharophilus]TDP11118.1 intracellular septation protein [Roseateles asaccharophilus]
MKLLLDFLPLILFFGTFKYAEGHAEAAAAFATQHFGFLVSGGQVGPQEAPVLLATVVVMVATLLQALLLKLRGQKIDLMLWISLALVVVLGGATIWFHSETFIKWKPTGLYWAMALVFFVSQRFFNKNLIQAMLGKELQLPAPVWRRLNWAWVAFFAVMGVLNLYVAYHFSTSSWANFKVFGTTGLMLIFTLIQGLYLSKYLGDEVKEDAKP